MVSSNGTVVHFREGLNGKGNIFFTAVFVMRVSLVLFRRIA